MLKMELGNPWIISVGTLLLQIKITKQNRKNIYSKKQFTEIAIFIKTIMPVIITKTKIKLILIIIIIILT
jgi:hypothetical protein